MVLGRKCIIELDPCSVSPVTYTKFVQYYSIGSVPITNTLWQRAFGHNSQGCWDYDIDALHGVSRTNHAAYNLVVEHILELQTIAQFIRSTITGVMRSGENFEDFVDGRIWRDLAHQSYPTTIPPLNGQTRPIDRIFSTLGTRRNTAPFVLLDADLNSAKLNMWGGSNPVAPSALQAYLAQGTAASFQTFIDEVRQPIVVLQYLADANVRAQARDAYRALRAEMFLLSQEARNQGYRNPDLHHMLDRWFRDHIDLMIRQTRNFMERFRIEGAAAIRGSGVQAERELLEGLIALWDGAADFEFDYEGWFSDDP